MSATQQITSNIYPSLSYDDAPAAIGFLCRAFGFRKRLVVPGPDGTVTHSELSYDSDENGSGVIMIGTSRPEESRVSPRQVETICQAISVYVDDPDRHYAQAQAAGATIIRELRDEEYGARGYMAQDPEGHQWYFGNYRPGAHWNDDR